MNLPGGLTQSENQSTTRHVRIERDYLVQMSRTICFRSAHFYQVPQWSKELNHQTFGLCFDPAGHGHRYELSVSVSGEIDHKSGLFIDLRHLDKILKTATQDLHDRHLNREVEAFKLSGFSVRVPTTENLALWIMAKLDKTSWPSNLKLTELCLKEDADLSVTISRIAGKQTQFMHKARGIPVSCVTAKLSILHQLGPESGICANLHGHDFKLEIYTSSVPRGLVRMYVHEKIVKLYHGRNLNRFFPNSSGEKLVEEFYLIMRKEFGSRLCGLALQETRKNRFECWSECD